MLLHKVNASILVTLLILFVDDISCSDNDDKGCHKDADVVFVLDESSSIWPPDFKTQLKFVQDVVDLFDIDVNRTRVGLETFGDSVKVVFQLGHHRTKESLKAAISAVQQRTGDTYTNRALQVMRTQLFQHHSRPWVPHVAIVITDGRSTEPENTIMEADYAHRDGIQIFAIGVGKMIDMDELKKIASSPGLVFHVEGYGALDKIKELIAWKTCEITMPPTTTLTTPVPTTKPQMIDGCTGYKPMDHIWSIPDLVDEHENDLALDFIHEVTAEMKLGPSRVQVGLTPRQCQAGEPIRLKEYDTMEGLDDALERRRYNTNAETHNHLRYIRTEGMTAGAGARNEATKFGLLIVDKQHGTNLARARAEADRAKRDGITLIVIGVGNDVEESELVSIASSADDVLTVDDYEQLPSVKSRVIARLCNGLMPESLRRFYMKRLLDDYEDKYADDE